MELYKELIDYCESNPTIESCGLIINKRGRALFYPCKNISTTPETDFIIDPIEAATAKLNGEVLYIVHSHVDVSEEASRFDKISCNSGKTPWIIYSLLTKRYSTLRPENVVYPLTGREYYYGIQDCWSLIKDVFSQELKIDLIYPADPDSEWWLHGKNYFNDLMDYIGFFPVEDGSIRKYDVILMQTGNSPCLNHSAVYYGDNIILHHAYGRLSCREVYGGYWAKVTGRVIRHKDLA